MSSRPAPAVAPEGGNAREPMLDAEAGSAAVRDEGRSFDVASVPRPRSTISDYCERFAVVLVFTIFVVFRAADRAFLYRVNKYLSSPAYNMILSNIFWPISIQLMTVVMLFGYILIQRSQGHRQYNWKFFLPGNVAASAMGAVPLYRLALFSLGDQINAAMSSPPAPYVSLPMQSIMTNFVLVWMLGLASVWLGTRFKAVHYAGCTLIILSVVVGISDKLSANDCSEKGQSEGRCLTAYKSSQGTFINLSATSMILWYSVFLLSTVPSAISNCYKQRVLKGRDVDVVYATWWSGNFQVIWGLLLFWVNWIPLPDQDVQGPSSTFSTIGDTWQCFIGNVPKPGDETCATAGGPAITWFLVYLCFNLTFNICLLWLTKYMSAVWAQIATTLCLDLTNIFSQYKFLVGDSAEPMTLSMWLATILASVALWVYNIQAEEQAKPEAEEEDTGVPPILSGSMVSEHHGGSFLQASSAQPRS